MSERALYFRASNLDQTSKPKHVKILFALEQDGEGYPPVATEGLWTIQLEGNRYRIDNIPFYARLIAYGDVVSAVKNEAGEIIFDEVIERSGHSTVRVFATDESELEALRLALKEMGCATEGSNIKRLFALDVPPSVPYETIKAVLETWELEGRVEYEEGCVY